MLTHRLTLTLWQTAITAGLIPVNCTTVFILLWRLEKCGSQTGITINNYKFRPKWGLQNLLILDRVESLSHNPTLYKLRVWANGEIFFSGAHKITSFVYINTLASLFISFYLFTIQRDGGGGKPWCILKPCIVILQAIRYIIIYEAYDCCNNKLCARFSRYC